VTFDRFTVVRVPFPFTDRATTKNRPALVLSDALAFNTLAGHSVMAMITSQANPPWPLDCNVVDLSSAGLPAVQSAVQVVHTGPPLGARRDRPVVGD
jgi:mRNA interferase MazF